MTFNTNKTALGMDYTSASSASMLKKAYAAPKFTVLMGLDSTAGKGTRTGGNANHAKHVLATGETNTHNGTDANNTGFPNYNGFANDSYWGSHS